LHASAAPCFDSHYDEFELTWPEEKSAWVEQAKAIGVYEEEKPETKDAEPDEKKEGRRLSAATLGLIEELKAGLVEFDEAIEALKGCRENMNKRLMALENGTPEEPGDDTDGMDEKSMTIRIVE